MSVDKVISKSLNLIFDFQVVLVFDLITKVFFFLINKTQIVHTYMINYLFKRTAQCVLERFPSSVYYL